MQSRNIILLIVVFLLACKKTDVPPSADNKPLADINSDQLITFINDSKKLQSNKDEIIRLQWQADAELWAEFNKVKIKADNILRDKKVYSVTFKTQIPIGGSKNDFYSLSRYSWPDPTKPDGLPYITKDGQVNPEINTIVDSSNMSGVCNDIYSLGLAYFFTDDERYVDWIKKLVAVFFIDPETKMNPNFEYAQIVKGRESTTGGASISALAFMRLVEGIQLIKRSENWPQPHQTALESWFNDFLNWMLTSSKGKSQRLKTNNIGTYYTVQTSVYALFIGKADLAREFITIDGKKRIEGQIASNGEMEAELKRPTSWNYVNYNLTAFSQLVKVSRYLNVDLWEYKGSQGGSVKMAFDWLLPYANGEKEWSYPGVKPTATTIKKYLINSDFYPQYGIKKWESNF